jgi:uncharacterized repeat protein (TIGR01451 family)
LADTALAGTITVANTYTSGAGSLRQAIAESSAGGTIVLPASSAHYQLTSSELRIDKSLAIVGAGARETIIDARQTAHRLFEIEGGAVTISGVTITGGNPSSGNGGAIAVDGDASLTLIGVAIAANSFEPRNPGDGGGLFAAAATTVDIDASTIADNTAYNGGGLYVTGSTTIENSTISGNHAGADTERDDGDGGGIEAQEGSLTLNNDTIADNESFHGEGSGGGVWIASKTTTAVANTIVADNADNTGQDGHADDCSATMAATGPDLESGAECGFALQGGIGDADPLLGPLADNGGPTDTQSLLAGSPAIGAGTDAGCPGTDQRGGARPQGRLCDIGAFEYGSLADLAATQAATPTSATVGENVTYQLTASNHGLDPSAAVAIQDQLPAGATLVAANPSQGTCSGVGPVTCALGTLAAGAGATVTLTARLTEAGYATNTVTVSGDATDPNPANNRSQLTVVAGAVATATPVLSNVRQAHARWRTGSALASFSRAKRPPPVGTRFSFYLNEAATVSLDFAQLLPGRAGKTKCVAQTEYNTGLPTCQRSVTVGTLSFAGTGGANAVSFQGTLSAASKLGPGSYTVTITALNSIGVQSSPKTRAFTIVAYRPPRKHSAHQPAKHTSAHG